MKKNPSLPELMLGMGQSMYRFSWAMTVFGAQQTMQLMNPLRVARSGDELAATFDKVSRTLESQLDDRLERVYRTGSALSLAPLGEFPPEMRQSMQKAMMQPAVFSTMAGFMPLMVASMAELMPDGNSRAVRQECEAKLEVMQLVQDTRALCPPLKIPVPLGEIVDRCYELGSFPALWAVEGIGHYLVESRSHRGEALRDLLTSRAVADLPSGSLTMLHAGLGLAFAERALEGLATDDTASIEAAIAQFLDDCRTNSRDGYLGCALESLGLVARHFYGDKMVHALDDGLARVDQEAQAYLWHGAGRALYFSPRNMVPGWQGDWPAMGELRKLARHDLAHDNLLAGLTWALTMTNLKQPEILERFLERHEEDFEGSDAFQNGIMSSLVMRKDTTPDDQYLAAFPDYEASADEFWWSRWVGDPARRALTEVHARLRAEGKLETVFRYQPISELGV